MRAQEGEHLRERRLDAVGDRLVVEVAARHPAVRHGGEAVFAIYREILVFFDCLIIFGLVLVSGIESGI